jgi:hypothetical membrane protein
MHLFHQANKNIYESYPKLGPLLFISGIQYFLIQIIVGSRFSPTYSLAHNTISDLGNTSCGLFNDRPICSPLHSLMNVSFLVLGLFMIVGSMLSCHQSEKSPGSSVGFSLFAIGGFGVVLVGLFPENTVSAFHGIGAALPFLVGNIGIVILGYSLNIPKPLRLYTLLSGVIVFIALGVYATGHYVGIGEGGIERVVAYPQTIWMIVIGTYLFLSKTACSQERLGKQGPLG